MTGFTDLHHHCMWGMDDGATSFDQAKQMLQQAAADGITTLAVTPHVIPGYRQFDPELYRRRLTQLRHYIAEEHLPLTLLEGCEIWYTHQTLPLLREGRIPTLGGSAYVLVEFPPDVSFKALEDAVQALFRGGYIPIIAHVERYHRLYPAIQPLLRLRQEADVCFQVNASTILSPDSLSQRLFLKGLFRAEAIDLIATDAHGCHHRISDMKAAFTRLTAQYGSACAAALTNFRLSDTPSQAGPTKRSISVERWHALAEEGIDLPMTIPLNGSSMQPLIRKNCDTVTILPLRRPVTSGDIVLFSDHRGRYVVHRVCKRKGDLVITIGDHCRKSDLPISEDQVWGLVTHVHRNRRSIPVNNPIARSLGRIWMALLPLRRVYYTIKEREKLHGLQ